MICIFPMFNHWVSYDKLYCDKLFAQRLVMSYFTPHRTQPAQYLPEKQLWSLKIKVELTY